MRRRTRSAAGFSCVVLPCMSLGIALDASMVCFGIELCKSRSSFFAKVHFFNRLVIVNDGFEYTIGPDVSCPRERLNLFGIASLRASFS